MKRSYSLKGRNCFSSLFKKGKRYSSGSLQFIILRHCGADTLCEKKIEAHPKIGVVVSKRYGKAFLRNRAKRRIRAIFQKYIPLFKDDFCMVVHIRGSHEEITFDDLCRDIDSFMQRSGLLKREL